jgi:hypothetical protein
MGWQESGIQTACLHLLQFYENQGKLYFIRNNSFAGHIQRANGSRGFINNSKKGAPDIIACIAGVWVGIEIKAKTKQSPEQKEAEQLIVSVGGQYWLIRDVETLQANINVLLQPNT